jgi:hypothetical protein
MSLLKWGRQEDSSLGPFPDRLGKEMSRTVLGYSGMESNKPISSDRVAVSSEAGGSAQEGGGHSPKNSICGSGRAGWRGEGSLG